MRCFESWHRSEPISSLSFPRPSTGASRVLSPYSHGKLHSGLQERLREVFLRCISNGLSEHDGPSPAFRSLEDRIDRKLQQKFGELQATSNAALHEVQLVREEFTKQADDAVLSAAAGVDAATWAHRRHQARSCRPEGGKSVHVSNAHCIPAGPGDGQHSSIHADEHPPFLHPAVLLVLRLRGNGFLRIVARIMRVLMLIGKHSLLC